eukprot:TRINITY_DN4583_c0_g1_i5.p2 TRINITY_DN4583_c0_g1~~TRINITY_DN4583_c0_g1_i5.p2  ORF type:complete len:329 (+),score=105.12 TRINITY_DN4583_c0_g1_i5:64-1050(+)
MVAVKQIATVVGAFLLRNAGAQVPLANGVSPAETQAAMDAHSAREAAESAQDAAALANQVAQHSVSAAKGAHAALKRARKVLHAARTSSQGLSPTQQQKLVAAEAHLVSSSQALKGAAGEPAAAGSDLSGMQHGDHTAHLPKAHKGKPEHGELRYRVPPKDEEPKVQLQPQPLADDAADDAADAAPTAAAEAVAAESAAPACPDAPGCDGTTAGGIDIDTDMPYGELEAFGREDTAQELTEASITESDEMVDQLERAEVAEEKRAVFRALTRLRGAAITSFDGVARSQTGNIDEYNKVHKWRNTHPLRHLADEESDISKWAFPDNADF